MALKVYGHKGLIRAINLSHVTCVILIHFLAVFAQGQGPGNVEFKVVEESPVGTLVGVVSSLPNYSYTFQESSTLFEISASGTIRTLKVIDRESLGNPVIRLTVIGRPSNSKDPQLTIIVSVVVLDINDNAPVFSTDGAASVTITFQEDAKEGRKSIVTATDPDEGINGTIKYSIVSGNDLGMFDLDRSGLPLILYVSKIGDQNFDRETIDHYQLNVSAQDGGSPPRSGYLLVDVVILDVNDNTPTFHQSQYRVQVNESAPIGTLVFIAEATDNDLGLNKEISYHIDDSSHQFKIDENTGEIRTVSSPLACSLRCSRSTEPCNPNSCFITVEATDKGLNPLTGRAYLYIEVLDENDHDPVIHFSTSSSENDINIANVDENANISTQVFTVSVSDADNGINGETSLSIVKGNEGGYFSYFTIADFNIIMVQVAKQLDRETIGMFNLTFKAVDKGTPPRSTTAYILIMVNDANDHSPEFEHTSYRVSVSEFAKVNSFVASLRATDLDEGDNARLTYDIASGNEPLHWFKMDSETGLVTTQAAIDHEEAAQVILNISAHDSGSEPRYSYAILTIDIQDENDYIPKFSQSSYIQELAENMAPNTEIVTLKVIDLDSGINGTVDFSIHPDTEMLYPGCFSVQSSGKVLALKQFDREERDKYLVKVVATDEGPNHLSSTATIELRIRDLNDNRPKFSPREYYANIYMNDPSDLQVIRVFATDKDIGDFGKVTYSMTDTYNSFKINGDTGMISTSKQIQSQLTYRLTVSARDGGGSPSETDATVNVIVINMSSQAPEFQNLPNIFEIVEDNGEMNPQIGRQVGSVEATSPAGRPITYAIASGDQDGVFKINSSSGVIRTQLALDREDRSEYNLTVMAFDGERISSRKVTVIVTDVNDNPPVFTANTTEAEILENWPVGQNIFYAQAIDRDAGSNRDISFVLVSESDVNKVFAINASTGVIYLTKPTSFISGSSLTLKVTATDAGTPRKSSSMNVKVTVKDVNDHTPLFTENRYELFVSEAQTVNNVVKLLSAKDSDKSKNAELSFNIIRGNDDKRFGIFPDGSFYLAHVLDREKKDMYSLTVEVKDNGQEPRSSAVNITIYVVDENDNEPVFSKNVYEFFIVENKEANTYVGTVKADDLDVGRNADLLYSLGEGNDNFTIDPFLGTIFSSKVFDREYIFKTTSVSYYMFSVYATDNGLVKLQSKAYVKVIVKDENDNPPVFLQSPDTTIDVSENTNINDVFFTLVANDADEGINAALSYNIIGGNSDGKFGINAGSGKLYLKDSLDRETKDQYRLTVKATDSGATVQLQANITLNIHVLDYNDNAPQFAPDTPSSVSVSENTNVGETLVMFSGSDRDIGISATLRFDIVSGNGDDVFSLGVSSGKLTLSKLLDYEASNHGDHSLNISLSDAGFPSLSVARMFTVKVEDANDNSPIFLDGISQLYFNETTPVNTSIAQVSAVDKDSGDFGTVRYRLFKQTPAGNYFIIHPVTGELTLNRALTGLITSTNMVRLVIYATDQDKNVANRRTAEKNLSIVVRDANDNAPVFQSAAFFLVPYNTPAGSTVATVLATDLDQGDNARVTYSFSGQRTTLFSINPTTGAITLNSALQQTTSSTTLSVTATDGGVTDLLGAKSTSVSVTFLYVISGTGPVFAPTSPNSGRVRENQAGTPILRVDCSPSVAGRTVEYYITRVVASGRDQGGLFAISKSSGDLSTLAAIDREALAGDTLILDITAIEVGGSYEQKATTTQVSVYVEDENDNPPAFSSTMFDASVSENVPVGSSVMRVSVTDPDTAGTLTLALSGTDAGKFRIVQNGTIYLVQQLDYETARFHDLVVEASDTVFRTTAAIRLNVIDENDNTPRFSRSFYTFDIAEDSKPGYTVGTVLATDADSGSNGHVIYSVISDWGKEYFLLDTSRGTFVLIQPVDFEERQLYTLKVMARDEGSQPRSTEVIVYMNVKDVNDNQPEFDPMSYFIELSEDAPVGSRVVNVSATDVDSGLSGDVRYSLVGATNFAVGPLNGSIYTVGRLDREAVPVYNVIVMATDQAPVVKDRLSTTATVQVKLRDVNDNTPTFLSPATTDIREDAKVGSTVFTVSVSDLDEGVNSKITFRLLSQSTPGVFAIDPQSGSLVLRSGLDRETISNHTLVIEAKDGGTVPLATQQSLLIQVTDANDNPPVFTQAQYVKTINEDIAVGTSVLRILATDRDIGFNGAVRYFILSGEGSNDFNLDMSSGVLRVKKGLDYERRTSYTILVQAEDSSVENRLQANTSIVITLVDINDFVPVFDDSPYVTYVQEGMPDGPVPIITITARDEDSGLNGQLDYSLRGITSDYQMFGVNSTTGQVYVTVSLDRENVPMYVLAVVAMDRGNPVQIGTATVTVIVKDVNDHTPKFDSNGPYLANVMENMQAGTSVITVAASDSDEGINSNIVYTLADSMGSRFSINPSTALITTTASLDRELETMYTLTVIATDQGIPPRSAAVQVIAMVGDDNDHAPEFGTSTYTATMYDPANAGDFVIGVTAVDQDIGNNGKVVYTLEGPNQNLFLMDGETGVVTMRSALTTTGNVVSFLVRATDQGKPSLNSSASVSVTLSKSATSTRPVFKDFSPNLNISENAEAGVFLTTVQATSTSNSRVTYHIAGGNVNNGFTINSETGGISVAGRIDYEVTTKFKLWLEARDQTQLSTFKRLDIAVLDQNDNWPTFSSALYTASVLENCAVGTSVFTVVATDLDSGLNKQIVYRLKNGNENNTFALNTTSGQLSTLNRVVDREKIALYNLEIEAADMGVPSNTASTTVRVTILDVNDNEPKFVGPRSAAVPEDLPVGSLILQLSTSDLDIGDNAKAVYGYDNTEGFPFVVDPQTGKITNKQALDAELQDKYTFIVSVSDGSFVQKTSLNIRVLDVNDNPPRFRDSVMVFNLTELQPPSTRVTQLTALDQDKSSPNNKYFFSLRRPSSLFELNPETGDITALESMRFYGGQPSMDTMNEHVLDVLVTDLGIPSLSSEATVYIRIIDANDHSPVFVKSSYFSAVPVDIQPAQVVLRVTAKDDMDYGRNAEVVYSIVDGSGVPYFTINTTTGEIFSSASLTGNVSKKLTLTVRASDRGLPVMSTTIDVQFEVTDPNVNAPRFNSNPFTKQVLENVSIGYIIDTITATDSDSGLNGEVQYFITSGNNGSLFAINPDSGRLTVEQPLDYETQTSYTVTLTARDKALFSKEVSRDYLITLLDVNDNKPVFDQDYYDAYVQENNAAQTYVFTLSASDADTSAINKIIRYSIVGDASSKSFFQIDNQTGVINTGNSMFDYETRNLFTLLVMAYNPDPGNGEASILKSVTTVYVHITGVNEDSPHFIQKSYSFQVSESAEMGTSVGRVTALDKDHGIDGVVYYYLEAQSNLQGFTMEPLTGVLKVSKRPDYETSPSILLTVIAKNWGSVRGNDTDTCTINITVIDANDPPEFSQAVYHANVTENSPGHTLVTYVSAVDRDLLPENRLFKFVIVRGNVPERFSISQMGPAGSQAGQVGKIETSGLGVLDRETTAKYSLVIAAQDLNTPSIQGTSTVEIELLDVNDNAPRFNPQNLKANVSENETAGVEVITLRDYTIDADIPPNQGPYRYKMKDGAWSEYFSMNELTGRVETLKALNRDISPQFVIPVVVTDNGIPTMTSTLTFTVVVSDINNSQPKPRPLQVLVTVMENQFLSGKIADVRPLDSDTSDKYTCTILSGDAAHFVINKGCDLEAVSLGPELYKLKIKGWDDKFSPVQYDVSILVQAIGNTSLANSVATVLANEKASTFLEKKFSLFKTRVQEAFGAFFTCNVFNLQETGSDLRVMMYIYDSSKRFLSTSDIQRGLMAAKAAIEASVDVSIKTITENKCGVNPCKNGGGCSTLVVAVPEVSISDSPALVLTSVDTYLDTSCTCMPAFTGAYCEQSQQPCGGDYCYHGGTCFNNTCRCPDTWQGTYCQLDVNECLRTSLCKNGATCHNIDGGFECICPVGYQGKYCDSQNFCTSKPCSSHGTCQEQLDSFQCVCDYGYYGPLCQFSSMSFQGGSYVQFKPVDSYHIFNLTIYFATVDNNSLLVFSPVTIGEVSQGFLAVEVIGGKVKVSFLLDPWVSNQTPRVLVLSTTGSVNTGYWYRLELTKVLWTATLIVQRCTNLTCDSCVDKRRECYHEMDYISDNRPVQGQYISIGGVKNFADVTDLKGLVKTHDFTGCIHSVTINSKSFGLSPGGSSAENVPVDVNNVTDTCPRKQAGSPCLSSPGCYNNGICLDKWSHAACQCSNTYMDDLCLIKRQPFSFGTNSVVRYSLLPSYLRDAMLTAISSSRRRRAIGDSTLALRFRTLETEGVLFKAATSVYTCVLWFSEGQVYFMVKDTNEVTDPLSVAASKISDGLWHNVTVTASTTGYSMLFDDTVSGLMPQSPTFNFDTLDLVEMSLGGQAVVKDNKQIKGFSGCLSQFLINGELQPLNGTSDKYNISSAGGVEGSCSALCANNPCGGSNKCVPDGELYQCLLMAQSAGLETGIIVVIVFFAVLLIAIIVVFVLFRVRRDLFHRCVRNKKENGSMGDSSNGKPNISIDNIIGTGGMNGSSSRYSLNPSEEEMIIRNHIAENLSGQKALTARPDLIGSNFSPQPFQLSDGTVIMETGLMLPDEDAPEHYDFENASSIAPSDIAPSEMIRHYRDFRNGTHHHHHHHHHHHQQPHALNSGLLNKYRDNSMVVPPGIRQSPISLTGSALSVPATGTQPMVPNGRPSSALAALNHSEGNRMLTQLNVRSPHNYTLNPSRSSSLGSHHSHSSSSSATGPPSGLIAPFTHKPINNKFRNRPVPKGLTVEDVNRLNARPDMLVDPVSMMDVVSSSVDGRPRANIKYHKPAHEQDNSLLLEPPDSSSSDSGANDSFTCSEFEYENDNPRTRLDLDPGQMIFSKLTEVENETDDLTPLHQKSGVDGVSRTPEILPFTNQYDFDALLNWGPKFDKLVGVFRDIAQLPDTGQRIEGAGDHDYEEYV